MSKRRSLIALEGSSFQVVSTFLTTPPEGWLLFNGDTVGSAASSATKASADYEYLFKALWDNLSDTYAPVTGGRGASAAADWTANKKIALIDLRGRTIIGAGTGSGLTARTLGASLGEETHTTTIAEMPLHGHPFRQATGTATTSGGILTGTTSPANQASFTGTPSNTLGQQIGGEGGGQAHNNMQPSAALNWMVKY